MFWNPIYRVVILINVTDRIFGGWDFFFFSLPVSFSGSNDVDASVVLLLGISSWSVVLNCRSIVSKWDNYIYFLFIC